MKQIVSKVAIRKELGLSIGEREVTACEVASTPIGRVEVKRASVPYEMEGLSSALDQLFSGWMSRNDLNNAKISVGLPTLRVFFSTRPTQVKHNEASPHVLLHEVIQSPTVNVDDMFVDLIRPQLSGRPLASIVSCRKKYLSSILAALEAFGIKPSNAEPAPCALVRLGAKKLRPPRKAKAYIRVFLGKAEGLVVLLASSDLALMWRPFSLTPGDESASVLAAISSVRIPGEYCGLKSGIDAVLIHGRPDLNADAKLTESPALQGIRVLSQAEPELNEGNIALGVAFGPAYGTESFNLVRSLVGRAKLWDVFPLGQVVLQVVLLMAVSLLLQDRLRHLRAHAKAASEADVKFTWAAKLPATKLQTEKKDLTDRVDSVRSFLEGRVLWSVHFRDLSKGLAPELAFSGLQGYFELESGGKGSKPRKSLLLKVQAPIPKTGAMPPEIDAFLRTLRKNPLLRREFPDIELADLRWAQVNAKTANANFNVLCQPSKNAPAKAAPAKGKAK